MLTIVKGPYLQWPTTNSMTIMWETSEPATSKVDVLLAERIHSGHQGNYKNPEHVISTSSNEGYSKIHQITLNNLEPGTSFGMKIEKSIIKWGKEVVVYSAFK